MGILNVNGHGQTLELLQQDGQAVAAEAIGFAQQSGSLTIPNITAAGHADVAFPANAAFIGRTTIIPSFLGAPLANLALEGAWVDNLGVVTVRFGANTGNVT